MTIPSQTITIKDPGLGLIEIAANTPLLCGVSSSGTATQLVSVQSPTDAVTLFGQGPLVEDACRVLNEAGGPVLMCRLTGSVAGVNTAVTPVATGTGTITLSGAPYDSYNGEVQITTAGTLGAGKFKYALDAHRIVASNGIAFEPTWSADITIPAGGTYVIPNTGITMTFVPGGGPSFFALGDKHTWTSTEPLYVTADLDAAGDVFRLLQNQWRFIALSGMYAAAAAAATLSAGLSAELASEVALFRYTRGFMDSAGDTTSNTITAFAAVEDRRLALCYGRCVRSTLKPFAGWGTPKRAITAEIAARAAREQISTHLGRVATGALSGVQYISHDEFQNAVMDVAKFSTLRTWPNRPGFYITRANLRSPPGSDFKYSHNGFVMDVACSTVATGLQDFANASFRTTSTGTMDPRDAKDIEAAVLRKLRAQLMEPINAEGKRGHVSDINFTVDLTNNVLSTGNVNTEVAIRPLGYGEYFTTQIGFAIDVGN